METQETQVVPIGPAWLDGGDIVSVGNATASPTLTTAHLSVGGSGNTIDYGQWTYPITTSNWVYAHPPKIRLTLTEVQRLRKAAKKDEALKETLRKFTPHIEIEVDFP